MLKSFRFIKDLARVPNQFAPSWMNKFNSKNHENSSFHSQRLSSLGQSSSDSIGLHGALSVSPLTQRCICVNHFYSKYQARNVSNETNSSNTSNEEGFSQQIIPHRPGDIGVVPTLDLWKARFLAIIEKFYRYIFSAYAFSI